VGRGDRVLISIMWPNPTSRLENLFINSGSWASWSHFISFFSFLQVHERAHFKTKAHFMIPILVS
jgi:hypothetical protein